MPQNQSLKDQVEKGFRTVDLLNDRPKPSDGLIWLDPTTDLLFYVPTTGGNPNFLKGRAAGSRSVAWRVSAGAETNYISIPVCSLLRRTDVKGIKVTGFLLSYGVYAVDLTAMTITASLQTFADRALSVQSTYGGSISYDVNHDTDAERRSSVPTQPHLIEGTFSDPTYLNVDLQSLTIEFEIGQPNTCQVNVYGAGLRIEHDYL